MVDEGDADAALRRRVESMGFEWMVFKFLPPALQQEILESGRG